MTAIVYSLVTLFFSCKRNLVDSFINSWLPFYRTHSLDLQIESELAFIFIVVHPCFHLDAISYFSAGSPIDLPTNNLERFLFL